MMIQKVLLRTMVIVGAFVAGSLCAPHLPGNNRLRQTEAAWLLLKFQDALADASSSGDVRPLLHEMQLVPLAATGHRNWYGSSENLVGVRCRFVVAVETRPDGKEILSAAWIIIKRGAATHLIRFSVADANTPIDQEMSLVPLELSGADDVKAQVLSLARKWSIYCHEASVATGGVKAIR